MLHDLGKDVMTFRHRALPRDGEVARCARIIARVGIETASNSMFSFVVQYITVYRPTNVGTLVVAGIDPRRAGLRVVGKPTDDDGVAVGGQCNRSTLLG